jgi:hypothetical protein
MLKLLTGGLVQVHSFIGVVNVIHRPLFLVPSRDPRARQAAPAALIFIQTCGLSKSLNGSAKLFAALTTS